MPISKTLRESCTSVAGGARSYVGWRVVHQKEIAGVMGGKGWVSVYDLHVSVRLQRCKMRQFHSC
jgi:hypothetical protein